MGPLTQGGWSGSCRCRRPGLLSDARLGLRNEEAASCRFTNVQSVASQALAGRKEPRIRCFSQLPAFLLVPFLSIVLASPLFVSAVPADWEARKPPSSLGAPKFKIRSNLQLFEPPRAQRMQRGIRVSLGT